jgi:hypothetical protein
MTLKRDSSPKQTDYLYGKAHHGKFPYVKRISLLFDEYLERVRQVTRDHRINNLIVVDLRNEINSLVDEIYQQLSVELKENITIAPMRRKTLEPANDSEQFQCMICGERRVTNACHIIPREHSGSNFASNIIYLCPNHHFLFDQAKLSENEFARIDASDKAPDSIEFFQRVHKVRHEMYWRYGTNKSTGCDCGSLDFDYDVILNGNLVQPCLVCKNCGEKWFLGSTHPLIKEMSVQVYDVFEKIEETEKERRTRAAMDKVRAALAAWLDAKKTS